MSKVVLLVALGMLSTNLLRSQTLKASAGNKIILTNTSFKALSDKPIAIKRKQLPVIPSGTVYPLILSAKGDTIPAQLDDLDEDKKWDELFFVVNLPSKATQTFTLKWLTSEPSYKVRTSVRFGKRMSEQERLQNAFSETMYIHDMPRKMGFQRYQTDGPSWENDKVGFRHYLDGRNAKDVFGKKVSYMSLDSVGINAKGAVEDNYHVMEPWGRDVLAVGNSIGIGGVALLSHDSILRMGVTVEDTLNNVEKTSFHIVREGPVRSVINFKYTDWKPGNKKAYEVEETTSIWPGMYAFHSSVNINGTEKGDNLLIGIVSIFATKPPTEIRVNNKWVALFSHERHSYNKEWWLPLALILPADSYLGFIEAPKTGQLSHSYLAKMRISAKPVEYYSVACWEISDPGFREPAYFRKYVENLTTQISAEVKVVIK